MDLANEFLVLFGLLYYESMFLEYPIFGRVPVAALHSYQAEARVHMLYSNTFIYAASIYPFQPAPNTTNLLHGY